MLFSLPPLSPGAEQIERRLDTVRSVCHLAQKRLIACLQGQHGTDPDKRHVSTALCVGTALPATLLPLPGQLSPHCSPGSQVLSQQLTLALVKFQRNSRETPEKFQ